MRKFRGPYQFWAPSAAGTDEECVSCAYPFDPGDRVLESDGEQVACTEDCATEHDNRLSVLAEVREVA